MNPNKNFSPSPGEGESKRGWEEVGPRGEEQEVRPQLGISYDQLSAEVRSYADNLQQQVRDLFSKYGVGKLDLSALRAKDDAGEVTLEDLEELERLLETLNKIRESGKIPEYAELQPEVLLTFPGRVDGWWSRGGIVCIEQRVPNGALVYFKNDQQIFETSGYAVTDIAMTDDGSIFLSVVERTSLLGEILKDGRPFMSGWNLDIKSSGSHIFVRGTKEKKSDAIVFYKDGAKMFAERSRHEFTNWVPNGDHIFLLRQDLPSRLTTTIFRDDKELAIGSTDLGRGYFIDDAGNAYFERVQGRPGAVQLVCDDGTVACWDVSGANIRRLVRDEWYLSASYGQDKENMQIWTMDKYEKRILFDGPRGEWSVHDGKLFVWHRDSETGETTIMRDGKEIFSDLTEEVRESSGLPVIQQLLPDGSSRFLRIR